MRKILLTALMAMQWSLYAQDSKIIVDNQTPGRLSSLFTNSQKNNIEELTITGYINKADMAFINSLVKDYNLKVIDLGNVKTIDGDYEYYIWKNFLAFGSEKELQKVRLPLKVDGVTSDNNNGSIICSQVDTLEIGWQDLSVIGSLNIWEKHAKNLILLEGVQIIPYRYFMLQSDYDFSYYNRWPEKCYSVSLPNTVTIIGGRSFGRFAVFDEPFSFPDSAQYIGLHPLKYENYHGNYGHANENSWCERKPTISEKKFSFPYNMHFYNSLDYESNTAGGTRKIFTSDEFVSDTIIVYEKCDTLFAI